MSFFGSSSPPPTIESQLMEMQRLQQRRALKSVNEMADRCFDLCINDFGVPKSLRSQETECLDMCVQKYLAMSLRSGHGFAGMYGRPLR